MVLVSSTCELAVTDSIVERSRPKVSLKVESQTSSASDTYILHGIVLGGNQASHYFLLAQLKDLSHLLKLILSGGQLTQIYQL